MPYRVDLPNGESVRTDELLTAKVIDFAKKHETSWSVIVEMPQLGDGSIMRDMFETFCNEHGCPTSASTMTMKALAKCFVRLKDETDDGDGGADDAADPSTVDAPAKS